MGAEFRINFVKHSKKSQFRFNIASSYHDLIDSVRVNLVNHQNSNFD